MAKISRAALAMGLGMLGIAGLVSVSYGQGDGAVRKTSAQAPTAERPPSTGTV